MTTRPTLKLLVFVTLCSLSSAPQARPNASSPGSDAYLPTAAAKYQPLFDAIASDQGYFFGKTSDGIVKLGAAKPELLRLDSADWDATSGLVDAAVKGRYTLNPALRPASDSDFESMVKRIEVVTITDDELNESRASRRKVIPFAIKKLGKDYDFPGAELAAWLLAHPDKIPAAMKDSKDPTASYQLFGTLVGHPRDSQWATIGMHWRDKPGKHNHAGWNFSLIPLTLGTWNADGKDSRLVVIRKKV